MKQTIILTIFLFLTCSTIVKGDQILPERGHPGYIGVTENPSQNKIFYWFFDSRDKDPNAPLVIYLNGGPGCSSIIDAVVTNGPVKLKPDGSLEKNPYSWNEKANVLYIEQPLGVGYSYGESKYFPSSAREIQNLMYEFFTRWLDLPQFQKFKGHPLWLTGVSYAGHYIPQLAGKFNDMKNPDINVVGIVIGNPWTNYVRQNPTALEYSMTEKKLTEMNQVKYAFLLPYQTQCQFGVKASCDIIFNTIAGPWKNWKFNIWDIQMRECAGDYLCYDFMYVHDFFNREDVKKELGVESFKGEYHLCNSNYMQRLYLDFHIDASAYLKPILNKGIKTLFFFGDKDMTVNWIGGDEMVKGIVWDGQGGYREEKFKQGKYGKEKSYKNLRFVVIPDAGHLATYNKPEETFNLFNEFLGLN